MLSSDIKRDERGVDRCNRKVFKAVNNKNIESYCGQPIVQRISDGVKGCPNCDKEPSVGNIHPVTINAASIELTPKELNECGLKEDYTKIKPEISINTQAMEAPVEKESLQFVKKDAVGIQVSLDSLEQCEDIPTLLIQAAIESMDNLPVTNFKESKRLIKLQEKMEALLTR